MLTLRSNITLLCFFFSLLHDKWWNIYESLAVVAFLRLGFVTAGAVGDMGLFITIHYMEQTGVSILTRCGVSSGCCKYFLAYLTPCSSKMSGFFFSYIKIQTQHKAIVPVH